MSELLNDLEDHIDRENLKRLLHYARRLAGFQSRVKYVLSSIGEVLESGMSPAPHCLSDYIGDSAF